MKTQQEPAGALAEAQLRQPAHPFDAGAAALGVRVALIGERARAALPVDGAAIRPDHLTELVVADWSATTAALPLPSVALDRAPPPLSVPAFDPKRWNPQGWVRNVESGAALLGNGSLPPVGATVGLRASPTDPGALRSCHHVEDVRARHANAAERAGALVRLAATGVPVRLADGGPELAGLVAPELHALMRAGMRGAGLERRERLSIRMRRIALRDHSLRARARQLCVAAGLPDPPQPPLVSVLLPTRRPELLACALANVARQNYPRMELVLALHGDGFGSAAEAARLPCPAKVVRAGASVALGSLLNLASAEAGGTLLAKMDDDDLYGPNHVQDLVLAHEHSGADVVGKGLRTVYLAGSHRTLRYCPDGSEAYGPPHLSGGALLVSRHALDRAGGWPRVACGEDRLLLERVRAVGGRTYRTHGAEYLVVRHGGEHTWRLPEREFAAHADVSRAGLRPSMADIEAPEGLSLEGFRRWQARGARP